MKSYEERMKSIQKKARGMKAVRFAVASGITTLCLAAVVLCVTLFVPYVLSQMKYLFTPTNGIFAQPSTPGLPDFSSMNSVTDPTKPTNPRLPPADPYIYEFEATRVMSTYGRGHDEPAQIINSVEALENFRGEHDNLTDGFEDVAAQIEKYDNTFFVNQSLIMLVRAVRGGNTAMKVDSVFMDVTGDVTVSFSRSVYEDDGEHVTAYWYFFIELDRKLSTDTAVSVSDCYRGAEYPALSITQSNGALSFSPSVSSVSWRDEFGTINADGPHPVHMVHNMVWGDLPGAEAHMQWSVAPTEVTVRCWNVQHLNKENWEEYTETVNATLDGFTFKEGTYVYMICATWSGNDISVGNGHVCYFFVEKGSITDIPTTDASEGCYPLVYAANGELYVIGAMENGVYITPQEFKYDVTISDGYGTSEKKVSVSWPELDRFSYITLRSCLGDETVRITGITVGADYMIKLETDKPIPKGVAAFGTYTGIPLVPYDAEFLFPSGHTFMSIIKVDLNSDGNPDEVCERWETQDDGKNIRAITVTRSGQDYRIEDWGEEYADYGLWIIPADIDQDGEMELFVCDGNYNRAVTFVAIYRFHGSGYAIYGIPVPPPHPADTNLEFWIGQNVADMDWSGYDHQPLFGGDTYLGKGYHYIVHESGVQQLPEEYVEYQVGAFPDLADGGRFVTDIWITDPDVTVYGLTIHSSKEDFIRAFTQLGYVVFYEEEFEGWRAELNGISFRFVEGQYLRISAEVTNRDGIEY